MAAGQDAGAVGQPPAGKFVEKLVGVKGQESQVVGSVNEQRFLGPARVLIHIGNGTDGHPGAAQGLLIDLGFDSLPHVRVDWPVHTTSPKVTEKWLKRFTRSRASCALVRKA